MIGPGEEPASLTVSVVIPVYNGADFVEDAIRSVYAQTVPPDEVIVVDDGSTDGTGAVLRRLQATLSRPFNHVQQANGGEASARNAGIREAHGNLIAFLDHDDVWHPTKLAKQVDALAREPALGASFTAYRRVRSDGAELVRKSDWNPDPEVALRLLMETCAMGPPSAVVVRRAVLERGLYFDETVGLGCDWLLWLSLALAGVRTGYIAEPLLDYRWHETNMSRDESGHFDAALRVFERFFTTNGLRVVSGRSTEWWRSRWNMRAAIDAIQKGERRRARRHIITAARQSPRSVRPGWIRMLGIGPAPR